MTRLPSSEPLPRISVSVTSTVAWRAVLGGMAAMVVLSAGWVGWQVVNPTTVHLSGKVEAAASPSAMLPPEPSPAPTAEPTAVPTVKPTPVSPLSGDLASQLQQYVQQHSDIQFGIEMLSLTDGKTSGVNQHQQFTAASTGKLVPAIEYLSQVDAGKMTLTQTIGGQKGQEELRLMINQSDNDAWEDFNDLFSLSSEQRFANQVIGLTDYQASGNQISAADLTVLLQKLWQGKLLSKDSTQLLLSYMVQTNEEALIPAAVPDSVTVYHKYGWLNGIVHDAAIVDDPDHPYILVILSNGSSDSLTDRAVFFQQIVQIVSKNM